MKMKLQGGVMQDSIFTKIIKGEVPSYKIYEDDKVFAFLDIYPITPGHTLVIPKKQVEFVWDMDSEDYQAVMKVAKDLAQEYREKLNVPYVGMKVVGTDVPHAHVHLIPFSAPHEFHGSQKIGGPVDHESLKLYHNKLSKSK